MSYADICRVTFTQKQLNRARKTFDDKRPELQRKWVQFSNLIGTQNPGGSFLIDGTITVNSGGYVPFTGSNNHNARTNNERFSNHKHHDWNIDVTRYNLVQTFGLPSGFIRDNQDARFVQMSLGTVQNTLVDAPIVGSDSVSFRDPWYVANASGNQPNQFITYDAPLFPTGAYNQTTGGVFLNENPNFDAGKPNYSVGAPNPNTINGFTSYFLNWTGHPDSVAFQNANAAQTGVVFKLSGATARALYKANRYSLSPSSGNDTLAKLCEIVSRKQLKICC